MKNLLRTFFLSGFFLLTVSASDPQIEKRILDLEKELQKLKSTVVSVKEETPGKKDEVLPPPTQSLKPKTTKDSAAPPQVSPKLEEKGVDLSEAPLPPKDFSRAQELFEQAQVMLGQHQLPQAQQIFEEIAKAYADSPYFLKAQYWLGELAFQKQDYMNASLAYGAIYQAYKISKVEPAFKNRVAESLVKFSVCLKMLRKSAEACVILSEFGKEFKGCDANLQKFARDVSASLKCVKK